MYFFQFEAVPGPQSPRAADIAGGEITVFVDAPDPEDAELIARAKVMDYAWRITAILEARGPVPEHVIESDIPTSELARRAKREGWAMEIVAWPKNERDENNAAEVRRIGPPIGGSGRH